MALTAIDDGSGRVTSPAAAKTPAERARRWIDDIRLAQRDREWWYKQNRELIRRYKQMDRERPSTYTVDRRRRFSLFWSNIEVLKPATMARQPKAVVRRRYDDNDVVARTATQVLERAINFSVDICDGGGDRLGGIRDEYLLVGLGQAWVRYVPKMHTETPEGMTAQKSEEVSEGGQSYDVVDWEEALYDHVSWDDFLHNVARKWSEVRWVARRAFLTRDELCARFGDKIGKVVPLNHKQPDQPSVPEDRNDPYKKAEVWEVWDKPSKTVFWINLDYPLQCLDERDDPLELREFFPCPKPLLGTCGPDSLLPLADYLFYRTQCRDIDELTHRIGRLTDALKMRGFYAAGNQVGKQLQNLFEKDTNELIPVDSWAAYAEAGGVKGLIEWLPLDLVVTTITACIANRKQLIDDVYQITGISDIMRGDVDPNETATATQKKTTWGSSRVRSKQREIARFSCDLLGLVGEVICNKFDPKTLAQMTNVKLLPDQQARQQLMALAMARAAPPPLPPPGPPPAAQGGPPPGSPVAAAAPGPGGPPAPPQGVLGPPGGAIRPPGASALATAPGAPPAAPVAAAPPGAAGPPPPAPPPQGGPPVGNPAVPAPAGPPPPPPLPPMLMDMLQRPTWEDVMTMLRDEAQRTFRIDIETNSTIEPDATEEVQDRVQVTQVLGLYISKTIPLLQLYPATAPLVAATAKWLIQSMHAGREIEEDFDKALDQFQMAVAAAGPGGMPGQQQQNQQQAATQQAQLMSASAKVSSAQTDQFKAQTERMKVGAETQTDRMQIQAEMQRTQAEHMAQAAQQGAEHASDHAMQLADQQHSQDMDLRDKLHEVLIQQEARRFARDVTAPTTETGLEPNPIFRR